MAESSRELLTKKHDFLNDSIFRLKSSILIAKRLVKNIFSPIHKYKDEGKLIKKPIIAFSESDLWNPYDNKDNWILTAGKIENLRIAIKLLNGIEIKKNEVFSFWKHIGNPNIGKKYVVGREIREGCILPTIAGGLCQLSNALYDAALKANFDIVERHKHTRVIKGSLAEKDRDATVKWNYIDLRFKSSSDFRIEIELTSDKLIVVFKSEKEKYEMGEQPIGLRTSSKLNDCYSCGNVACFKHPDKGTIKQDTSNTTFILDEKWPEFDSYIQQKSNENDFFITTLKKNSFIKTNRYDWTIKNKQNLVATTKEGIYRAMRIRYAQKNKTNFFELFLNLDKTIAKKAAMLIPIESTHIVVSQNLLPFLFESGALGGRTFDVLMTRLPFEMLHQRLDEAYAIYPESKTLNDFRAPNTLIDLENIALTKARKIITPHSEIAELFKNKAEQLSWDIPITTKKLNSSATKILFPASAVGRKGAYEIKKLAIELNLQLAISGNTLEHENFWFGLTVEKFNGNFDEIRMVIYPAYIEHQPRLVLKAISLGIPVLVSNACGLDKIPQISIFKSGDYESLKKEVEKRLFKVK